jgi:deoxycytidylate deaminase
VRYGLLAISALSYTENQGGATGVTENQGDATGCNGSNREPGGCNRSNKRTRGVVTSVNKNCVDKIMDFLENTLKIEDTKSIQIEKA